MRVEKCRHNYVKMFHNLKMHGWVDKLNGVELCKETIAIEWGNKYKKRGTKKVQPY